MAWNNEARENPADIIHMILRKLHPGEELDTDSIQAARDFMDEPINPLRSRLDVLLDRIIAMQEAMGVGDDISRRHDMPFWCRATSQLACIIADLSALEAQIPGLALRYVGVFFEAENIQDLKGTVETMQGICRAAVEYHSTTPECPRSVSAPKYDRTHHPCHQN